MWPQPTLLAFCFAVLHTNPAVHVSPSHPYNTCLLVRTEGARLTDLAFLLYRGCRFPGLLGGCRDSRTVLSCLCCQHLSFPLTQRRRKKCTPPTYKTQSQEARLVCIIKGQGWRKSQRPRRCPSGWEKQSVEERGFGDVLVWNMHWTSFRRCKEMSESLLSIFLAAGRHPGFRDTGGRINTFACTMRPSAPSDPQWR